MMVGVEEDVSVKLDNDSVVCGDLTVCCAKGVRDVEARISI
jgi:hypothetical protein